MQDFHTDWLTWLLPIYQVTLSGFAFNLAQVGWSSNLLLSGYFKVTFTICNLHILKDYGRERKTMTSNPEHSRGHFLINVPLDKGYIEKGSLIRFAWESSCSKSNRYRRTELSDLSLPHPLCSFIYIFYINICNCAVYSGYYENKSFICILP